MMSDESRLVGIFRDVEQRSIKYDSYFPVYERVLSRFVGKGITFVEVGVLDGGSLFMWRQYFGNARIIGIDFNPAVKKWESHGFEIHIGDQSSGEFWREFYRKVGPIDVLLDDGGHTNAQQIVTVDAALDNVRPGGLVMVEDAHTSYFPAFGNPSRFSFVNFGKHVADSVMARYPGVGRESRYSSRVFSVEFYESIVVFQIDPRLCGTPQRVSNIAAASATEDFRFKGTAVASAQGFLAKHAKFLKRVPFARRLGSFAFATLNTLGLRLKNRRLARFFD